MACPSPYEGFWAFERLAVVCMLSPQEGGWRPFSSRGGRQVVITLGYLRLQNTVGQSTMWVISRIQTKELLPFFLEPPSIVSGGLSTSHGL